MVMAGYFFNSAEYLSRNTSDAQYVTDLYNTFFNRLPDPGGLSYWTGQIAPACLAASSCTAFCSRPNSIPS